MDIPSPPVVATPENVAELDRLGDEIAELSAHLGHPRAAPTGHLP